MPDRSNSLLRSMTSLAALALLAAATPSLAGAQRVGGSIGVSLTILQPVATQAVRVTGFSIDENGVARLETTAPTSGEVSQLVMASVASSTNGFARVRQAPVILRGVGASTGAARRMSYLVNVGRTSPVTSQRDVELRVEYLAVAGT
jgi:hypothetical protein